MKMSFWDNFWSACFAACVFFFLVLVGALVIASFGIAIWIVVAFLFGSGWIVWPIAIVGILLFSLIMGIYLTIKDRQAERKEIIRERRV